MSQRPIDITGLGSVGPCGPVSGPLRGPVPAPSLVTAWPTAGPRYALPAAPFRAADVLPKVNTRRLDRLSVWSLAAAALALRDAGLDLSTVDGSRTAVVSATGFGCLDLTEAYLNSAHEHGWQQTDPIYFPETLGNVPGAHVARVFGCLGPNLTVGSRGLAAEAALLMAASLLRVGQADRVLVLAGDALTRGLFDWYEAAGVFSAGFVPSEGVAAMVLESPGRHRARARLLEARWVKSDELVGRTPWSARVPLDPHSARREQADEGVGRGPGGPPHRDLALRTPSRYPGGGSESASEPRPSGSGSKNASEVRPEGARPEAEEQISPQAEPPAPPTASGSPALVGQASACQRLVCKNATAFPCAIGDGLPDTGGLFRILTALGMAAPAEQLLVLGVARWGSHAMAVLEVPAHD